MPQISDFDPTPSTAGSDLRVCLSAQFETTRPTDDTAVVSAYGELDAANGNEFVDYALSNPDKTKWLVVDLSGLSFFATAGFSALHTLNVRCVGENIRWALVPSPAVNRLLRICDPDSTLPISVDVQSALTAVHDDPPRLLQLVPESS